MSLAGICAFFCEACFSQLCSFCEGVWVVSGVCFVCTPPPPPPKFSLVIVTDRFNVRESFN